MRRSRIQVKPNLALKSSSRVSTRQSVTAETSSSVAKKPAVSPVVSSGEKISHNATVVTTATVAATSHSEVAVVTTPPPIQRNPIKSITMKKSDAAIVEKKTTSATTTTVSSAATAAAAAAVVTVTSAEKETIVKNTQKSTSKIQTTTTHKPKKSRAPRYKVSFDPENPPDRTKMTMRDLIHWNPSSNPMKYTLKNKKAKTSKESDDTTIESSSPRATEDDRSSVAGNDESTHSKEQQELEEEEQTAAPAPQLTVGPDGSIILNEASLFVPAENDGPKSPINETNTVEEDENYFTTSLSYRNYIPTKTWTERETKRFYKAISTLGTDFSLIQKMFPKRTRTQLKNKFKREERINKSLIDMAIAERRNFDSSIFDESSDEEIEPKPKSNKRKQQKETRTGGTAGTGTTVATRSRKKRIKKTVDGDSNSDENESEIEDILKEMEESIDGSADSVKNRKTMETNNKGKSTVLSADATGTPTCGRPVVAGTPSAQNHTPKQVQYMNVEQIMSRVRKHSESIGSSGDIESPRIMSPPRVLMSPPPVPDQSLPPAGVDVSSLKPGEVILLTVRQPSDDNSDSGLVHVYMVSNDNSTASSTARASDPVTSAASPVSQNTSQQSVDNYLKDLHVEICPTAAAAAAAAAATDVVVPPDKNVNNSPRTYSHLLQ
ncbi:uncharacterized protein LOC141899443 [Tubulanus polymorphus]|uniref:uncharacterized protein LOC141899443 n=1 Tax=Tubulanus polymorphus TaxID=672921 RepID=UPI003DA3CFA7